MTAHASALRKNTSVDWIGSIPSAWEVKPLKHMAQFMNGMAFKPSEWTEGGTPIIRIENLNGSEQFNGFSGRVDPRYHVSDGDLLFGWSGNIGTSFGPFIWSRPGLHYLNQHIFKVTPDGCSPQWLYWCLMAVTDYVEQQAHGIIGMVHVTRGKLGAALVPVPPLCEQHTIADFLNRETAKIDALVATQERLIALLDEKRQATITHAVTEGLDPTAPMKESGVEWLGPVPVEWDIKPLKFLFLVRGGATPSKDELAYWNGGIPWVTPKDMKIPVISTTEDTVSPQALSDGRLSALPTGAILVVVRGMILAKRVPIAETSNPVTINQDMKALIFKASGVPAFFRYFLSACAGIFDGLIEEAGHGTKTLRTDWLGRIALPAPSASEQEAIVRYLDSSLEQFDRLTRQSTEVIERLRERRTALITAAVTGQIDVSRPTITEAAE